MEPALLLGLGSEVSEDLGVAGVWGLVAEDDRPPHRSSLDLVHQAELHLPIALAAELGWEVRGPQLLLLDLLLKRSDRAHEAVFVGLQDLEGGPPCQHEFW